MNQWDSFNISIFYPKFIYFNKYILCFFSLKICTVNQLKNHLKIQCARNSNEIKMTAEQEF